MARQAEDTHIVSGLSSRQEHRRQAGFLRCPCCDQGTRAPTARWMSVRIRNVVVLLSDMRRVRWAGKANAQAWLLCYVYAVGMRMSDVDVIGEELHQRDDQTRLLCSHVGDKMVFRFKHHYENAQEAKTVRN